MRNAAGALGIVGLFAAIALGMLATFGIFGLGANVVPSIPPGQEALAEATNERAEEAAPVGETVVAGDVAWTVSAAYPKEELRTYTFPPQTVSGSYVRLDFVVENVSDRPVTLTDETITLHDASGVEYLPEADRNSAYVPPRYNILFNELSLIHPGETKEGKVNFEVLPNAAGFVALLGDTDPSVSEGEYVDLGF